MCSSDLTCTCRLALAGSEALATTTVRADALAALAGCSGRRGSGTVSTGGRAAGVELLLPELAAAPVIRPAPQPEVAASKLSRAHIRSSDIGVPRSVSLRDAVDRRGHGQLQATPKPLRRQRRPAARESASGMRGARYVPPRPGRSGPGQGSVNLRIGGVPYGVGEIGRAHV